MTRSTDDKPSRIAEIDALRGLAAVAVMAFHYTSCYDEMVGHTAALPFAVPLGHYGVDLFFMLSGYVILMSLERAPSASQFAWARFTRLYPTFWCAAAITFVVVSIAGRPGQSVSFHDAIVNATLIPSLLSAAYIDPAYWSLEAEVIFYANMLVLYRLGALRRPGWAVVAWLLAALVVQAGIRWSAAEQRFAFDALRQLRTYASLGYLPLFAVGMLLRSRGASVAARVGGLAISFALIAYTGGATAFWIDLGLASLFAACAKGGLPWLRCGPLLWLGAVSYPLYLIHQNVGYVVIGNLEGAGATPIAAIAAATLLSLLLASWLHRRIEQPALATLRRIDPTAPLLTWEPAPRKVVS